MGRAWDPLLVLAFAFAIELALGDPVSRWHPVAQFGRWAGALFQRAPRAGRMRQLIYGAAVVIISAAAVASGAALTLYIVGGLFPVAAAVLGAILLKASFAYRQLETEALRVAEHLEEGRLAVARTNLQALVGRDTTQLSPALAASAAVESLAENLSDSFIAPLFYYVLFGVPGALAYRAINTLDAMVGYHGAYEYLGRVAARVDDVANFIPARLTTAMVILGAALARMDYRRALQTAIRDHGRTESPNAGWPMAAMAGALAVELEKPGYYRLGVTDSAPTPGSIHRAVAVTRRAAFLAALVALVATAPR
jgi:adenosylcobinamide-phosphate synthase